MRNVIILNAKTLIELKMEEYKPNRTYNHFKLLNEAKGADDNIIKMCSFDGLQE